MDVSENDALEQIQRLIQSDLFRFSELQRRLLVYLAEKSLRGEADQLKEYTIAVDALAKPESYDPRRDSAVRLQTGKLRQKIREYYVTVGQADPVLVDFPKGRFKLVFSHRDLSVPLEPIPEGPRRTGTLPWLLVTARNVVSNTRRSVLRQDRVGSAVAQASLLAAAAPGADETAIERARMFAALDELSALEREALLLTAWDGLPARDAAVVAGCSVRAFEVRLSRARAHLDGLLAEPSDPIPTTDEVLT